MEEQTQVVKPQLAKLVAAFAKAKSSMGKLIASETANVKSDKANYSYRYADLAAVLEVVDKPLASNGLVFVQYPMVTYAQSGARVTVHGTLYHESGEWIEAAPLEMVSGQIDPQRVGSAITYARRYQMQAFFGLAQEDDDGESAKQQAPKQQQRPLPPPPPPATAQHRTNPATPAANVNGSNGHKPAPQPTLAPNVESLADVEESAHGADVVPTEDEAAELHKQAMSRYHGIGTSTFGPAWEDVRHAISMTMQVESSSKFTAPQLNALADSFKAKSRQWQTWQRAMSNGTLPPVELAFGALPATN